MSTSGREVEVVVVVEVAVVEVVSSMSRAQLLGVVVLRQMVSRAPLTFTRTRTLPVELKLCRSP